MFYLIKDGNIRDTEVVRNKSETLIDGVKSSLKRDTSFLYLDQLILIHAKRKAQE